MLVLEEDGGAMVLVAAMVVRVGVPSTVVAVTVAVAVAASTAAAAVAPVHRYCFFLRCPFVVGSLALADRHSVASAGTNFVLVRCDAVPSWSVRKDASSGRLQYY